MYNFYKTMFYGRSKIMNRRIWETEKEIKSRYSHLFKLSYVLQDRKCIDPHLSIWGMSYGFTQIILLFLFDSIYIIINQGWMVLRGKDVITLKCVSFEI